MLRPVHLGWLWERWLTILLGLGCLLFMGGFEPPPASGSRAGAPPPPVPATSSIDVYVEASADPCAADAGACSQSEASVSEPSALQQSTAAPSSGRSAVPVADALVRGFAEREGRYLPFVETNTDRSGHARIEAPAGAVWLLVESPGRARRSAHVIVRSAVEAIRVALPEAETLAVQVLDQAGQPISEATVLVDDGDALPHAALTATLGSAQFTRVGAHVESVRVHARGYDSGVLGPGTRGAVQVTLSAPATLEVSVVHAAGEPASGADVWLAGIDFWPPRHVTAGADGVALLSGLSRGVYDVRAQHDGEVSLPLAGVSVGQGERARLRLELVAGRSIGVRVSDGVGPNAVPVADADVVLSEDGLSPFPLQGRTNTEGRVTLGPVSPRLTVVNVRAAGFMPENGVPVGAEANAEVQVVLVRSGRVSGEVVDPEGVPVPNASLEVLGDDLRGRPIARRSGAVDLTRDAFDRSLVGPAPLVPLGELGVMPGPLPIPGMPPSGAPPSAGWVSDLDGKYQLTDVPPGRIRVVVHHPDFVESSSPLTTLDPGGQLQLRLVLERGAALEGRLVDERGQGVARARIAASSPRATETQSVSTEADGYFAFGALPTEVELQIARPSDRYRFVARRLLELAPGERRRLDLVLPPERPEVSVLVSGEDRQRLSGAVVSMWSLEPEVPLRQTSRSDVRGEARLVDALGLRLTLRVQATGWRPFEARVDAAPARIEVTLERGIAVTGRITHVRGRQGLAGARVTLLAGGERQTVRSDADGQYQFADVSPGRAHLSVSHPGFSTEERDVVIVTTGRPDRAFELEALDLLESGSIAGTVVDSAGAPVQGARVGLGLVPAFLPKGSTPAGLVQTDAAGHFQLAEVRVGRVTVSAYAAGVGRGSTTEVEVRPDETSGDVEIRLSGANEGVEQVAAANVAITLGERNGRAALDVVVVDVAAGSEAERAGLRTGDILRAVDGIATESMSRTRRLLGGSDASDVIVEVERGLESLSLRVRREPVRR